MFVALQRSLPAAADTAENQLIDQVRQLLNLYEKSEIMIDAGLYEAGRNEALDLAISVWPDIDAFLAMTQEQGIRQSFDKLKLILRKAKGSVQGREARAGNNGIHRLPTQQ